MNGKCTLCRKAVASGYDLCGACFEGLKPIRVASAYGPCLRYYRFVRENRTTVTVAYKNGSGHTLDRVSKGLVHRNPCNGCTDHAKTSSPADLN